MREHEVIVIGAGPAGLAAARVLNAAGVEDVVVLEREQQAGGVPRHCHHRGFGLRHLGWPYRGPDYARRLVERAGRIRLRTGASVVGLEPGGRMRVATADGVRALRGRCVLLATGIRESPRSARLVSGERPDGVLTTGALQQMVVLGGRAPCRRPVVVGTEWVSFSALLTLRAAGARAAAMIEEGERISAARPADLVARWLLGTPVLTGVRLERILGHERVEGVEVSVAGERRRIECDAVVFSGRFVPEAALARQSHLRFDPRTGGPAVDQYRRCSDPAYFAAGNVLRPVETAGACALEGEAAARSILRALRGELPPPERVVALAIEGPLRFVCPQLVSTGARPGSASRDRPFRLCLRGQVSRRVRGRVQVLRNGAPLGQRRLSGLPGRLLTLYDGTLELDGLETIEIRLAPDPRPAGAAADGEDAADDESAGGSPVPGDAPGGMPPGAATTTGPERARSE